MWKMSFFLPCQLLFYCQQINEDRGAQHRLNNMTPVQCAIPFSNCACATWDWLCLVSSKKRMKKASEKRENAKWVLLWLFIPWSTGFRSQINWPKFQSLPQEEDESDVIYTVAQIGSKATGLISPLVTLQMIATPWNCNKSSTQRTSFLKYIYILFVHSANHFAFIKIKKSCSQ